MPLMKKILDTPLRGTEPCNRANSIRKCTSQKCPSQREQKKSHIFLSESFISFLFFVSLYCLSLCVFKSHILFFTCSISLIQRFNSNCHNSNYNLQNIKMITKYLGLRFFIIFQLFIINNKEIKFQLSLDHKSKVRNRFLVYPA